MSARTALHLVLLAVIYAIPARAQLPDAPIALVDVTVVDLGADRQVRANQTIVVVGGRIRAVGPTASTLIPHGARRVPAQGKYVIPGLWDSHVHFMNATEWALPMYLAHGITSVREMGGYIDSTRAWQARMAAGALTGPRILTPGPILESPRYLANVRERSVRDPRIGQRVLPYRLGIGDSNEAKKAIDSLVKLHVDFVKIRTTATPEAYFAVLREARRAGLQVAGHQPSVVSLVTAADSGQRDIEHAFGPPTSQLSEGGRDSVYAAFARNHTWYTPTLVVTKAVAITGDSAWRSIFGDDVSQLDERRPYAAPWLLEWWRIQVEERKTDTSTAPTVAALQAYASSVADVRRLHALGVPILAGTDAGSVLVYPGFSLHEELRLLVEEAGFSPGDALWSATVGPAQFAGLESELGAIAPGKIADLVVLDANPLASIRSTRRIRAVMQGGRLYNRKALDAMLARVRLAVGR